MFDRGDRDLHDKRVAAGTAVTLDYLVRLLGDLYNMAVIDARYAHSHKGGDGQADPGRVYLGPVSGNDMRVLELSHALNDGRRSQPYLAAQLGVARPGIFLQAF